MPVPFGLTAARTGSFSASLILFAVSCQPQRYRTLCHQSRCAVRHWHPKRRQIYRIKFLSQIPHPAPALPAAFYAAGLFLPQNEKQLTANSFGISFCALFQCQNLIQHMLCRSAPISRNARILRFPLTSFPDCKAFHLLSVRGCPEAGSFVFPPEDCCFCFAASCSSGFHPVHWLFPRHHTIRFFKSGI